MVRQVNRIGRDLFKDIHALADIFKAVLAAGYRGTPGKQHQADFLIIAAGLQALALGEFMHPKANVRPASRFRGHVNHGALGIWGGGAYQ